MRNEINLHASSPQQFIWFIEFMELSDLFLRKFILGETIPKLNERELFLELCKFNSNLKTQNSKP